MAELWLRPFNDIMMFAECNLIGWPEISKHIMYNLAKSDKDVVRISELDTWLAEIDDSRDYLVDRIKRQS